MIISLIFAGILHDERDRSAETQPSKSEAADLRRFQFVRANLVLLPDYSLAAVSRFLSRFQRSSFLSQPFNLCKSYSLLAAAMTKLRREHLRGAANKIVEYSRIR